MLLWLQMVARLTLPPGLADGLDLDVHGHALCCLHLAAVEGSDHDLVVLLVVIAQLLCVADVA